MPLGRSHGQISIRGIASKRISIRRIASLSLAACPHATILFSRRRTSSDNLFQTLISIRQSYFQEEEVNILFSRKRTFRVLHTYPQVTTHFSGSPASRILHITRGALEFSRCKSHSLTTFCHGKYTGEGSHSRRALGFPFLHHKTRELES